LPAVIVLGMQELTEEVLYWRVAAGAEPGICVTGCRPLPYLSSSSPLPIHFTYPPSPHLKDPLKPTRRSGRALWWH